MASKEYFLQEDEMVVGHREFVPIDGGGQNIVRMMRVVTIIDVVFCSFFDGFSDKLVA